MDENTAPAPTPHLAAPAPPRRYFLRHIILLGVLLLVCVIFIALCRHFRGFEEEVYDKKTDLNAKNIRPGLNIDHLPIVKVDYGNYRPNENIDNPQDEDKASSASQMSPSRNAKARHYARRQACLTKGYYLGKKNSYLNCAQFCGVSSDEEVQYFYFEKTTHVLNGRRPMQAGAWCLPKAAATCNYNTSILVYSINGWICLPRSDAFAGEGGNRIVVCNGSLWDNALQRQYDTFIPANLSFHDVYNDTLSDGSYRFTCPPNLRDDIKNKFIVSPYNRLHLLRNWCLEDIPFGQDNTQPDLKTGQCLCSAPYQKDAQTGKCTSCAPRFDVKNYTSHLYNRPCFSVRDYPGFLLHLRQLMSDPEKEILLPCGLNDAENISNEQIQPRCLDTAIQVYKPLLASANTLKRIAAVL